MLNINEFKNRFWNKVFIKGPDECWPWLNCLDSDGYGGFCINNKMIGSHIVAWIIDHNGEEPTGEIRHTCDIRRCCNPKHLIDGTHQDNMSDMSERKRAKNVPNSGNFISNVTKEEENEIRSLYGKFSYSEIAKMKNVSIQTVCNIVNRRHAYKIKSLS